jgi:hypothetical protein
MIVGTAPGSGSTRSHRGEWLERMEINSRISVMLSSKERAYKVSPELRRERIVEPHREYNRVEAAERSISLSLEEMFQFDVIMQNLINRHSHRVVVCTGSETSRQARTLMLLGCHMVMSQGMAFEETLLRFRPLQSLIQTYFNGISAFEVLLRAICCAKCLNWIDFGFGNNDIPESGIQMDEYIHYAR